MPMSKLESQKNIPLRGTMTSEKKLPVSSVTSQDKRKVLKRGFTFTADETVNDPSTSHIRRLNNIHDACDNELENTKQVHLFDQSPMSLP